MPVWRLITTWGAPPSFNMGLDEALLRASEAPPTLRFYSWSPDTLSLGYFQRYDDVPEVERAGAVVRRITGGGAIHHTDELTYSLATGLDDPLFRGPVADSYARIHDAIAAALGQLGIRAARRGEDALDSDQDATGMCFHRSTPLDLAWGGRKGVGSAQRRTGGRVLHHGSIKLDGSRLDEGVAGVRSSAPEVELHDLAREVRAGFERELGLAFELGVPGSEERSRARVLGTRYLDPAFTRRR